MPKKSDPQQLAKAIKAYYERKEPPIAPLAREFGVAYGLLRTRIRVREHESFMTDAPTQSQNESQSEGQNEGQNEGQKKDAPPTGESSTAQQSSSTRNTNSQPRDMHAGPTPQITRCVPWDMYKPEGKTLEVFDRWIDKYIGTLPEGFRATAKPPPSRWSEVLRTDSWNEKLSKCTSPQAVMELYSSVRFMPTQIPQLTSDPEEPSEEQEGLAYDQIVDMSDLIYALHKDMQKDQAKLQRLITAQLSLQDRIMQKSAKMSHLHLCVSALLPNWGIYGSDQAPYDPETSESDSDESDKEQEQVEQELNREASDPAQKEKGPETPSGQRRTRSVAKR